MAQLFGSAAVLAVKLTGIAAVVLAAVALLAWHSAIAARPSPGAPVQQPLPFSHKHHAGDDGIDCRYCHASVEQAAFAGMPSLHTCMSCHSQLYADAPVLQQLRAAFSGTQPLAWRRVDDLPGFVYFDHSIHVNKGVGCSTCHGEVDRMPLTWRVAPLSMQWCIDCHRAPEAQLRPQAQIYDMRWRPPADQPARGAQLHTAYAIHSTRLLTACSTCHR
ncbi:MAG TPA: cytochrome c3 family protein [Steroidobacteraceae bacterium]|nr:cytochrome c3 family protein [Steroidobacteraceae bacterium]